MAEFVRSCLRYVIVAGIFADVHWIAGTDAADHCQSYTPASQIFYLVYNHSELLNVLKIFKTDRINGR